MVYSWVGIRTQASLCTSRLSCHDVPIHCFVTTKNIFYSLESSDLFCLSNSSDVPTESHTAVLPLKLEEIKA